MKIYYDGKNFLLKRKLKKLFEKTLIFTDNFMHNLSVGVKFVSKEEIKELNKEHRDVDKVTDVLSFPMLDINAGQKISEVISTVDQVAGEIYLGDIVVCKDKVYTQAKEYNQSRGKEMCYLALHSFLHLLGYDHQIPKDEKQMFELAEKILGYGR